MAYNDAYDSYEPPAQPVGGGGGVPQTWSDVTPQMWARAYGLITGNYLEGATAANPYIQKWIGDQIKNQVSPQQVAKQLQYPDTAPQSSEYNALYKRMQVTPGYANLWDDLMKQSAAYKPPTNDPANFYNTGYNFNPLGYGGKMRV